MGPRFHLRLEEGEGRLDLAQPLRVGPLSIASLTLSVGAVTGTVELGGGATALRNRRSRVLGARMHVPITYLREQLQVRPDSVRADGRDLRVEASEMLERRLETLQHARIVREAGELRIVRALHVLLVEAMVPHGWRAPSDEGTMMSARAAGDALHLEAEPRS